MKLIINIKENANPKNGDVLEYSKKEGCYILVPKTKYEKKLEKQMSELTTKFDKTKLQVGYMAKVLKDYINKGDK